MDLIQRAKELRTNSTDAERGMWSSLRGRQFDNYKFRRQQPIGFFIADFVCFEKKLIIELDGGQHMENESHDIERTKWLEGQGFSVLRFWNNQVLKEVDAVKSEILSALQSL